MEKGRWFWQRAGDSSVLGRGEVKSTQSDVPYWEVHGQAEGFPGAREGLLVRDETTRELQTLT